MRGGELNRWWRIGLALVTPLSRVLLRVRVEGIERVPVQGPAVLAFNHLSFLDGPVLAIETARRIRRETRYLVAAELFGRPVIGRLLRLYNQIPIRRGDGDVGALEEATEAVRRGALTGIAPEGRVNYDTSGGLQRIRTGVARIALPTGAPIVPVGIWGTQVRWPRDGLSWRRPFRTRVGLAFGAPILPVGELAHQPDLDSLAERLRERLEEQVGRAKKLAT